LGIMMDHPQDDLELYALGMLEPSEHKAIDEHVAACPACLQRLVEAEAVGASLADALVRHAPSRTLASRIAVSAHSIDTSSRPPRGIRAGWWMATAAALALFVGAGWQNHRLTTAMHSQDVILATLVHSHFEHVNLTTSDPSSAFGAKALYARDGSWMYLILDHAPPSLHVLATEDASVHDLGEPARSGDVATLFVRPSARITNLDLDLNGVQLATGRLVYGEYATPSPSSSPNVSPSAP
ncbi:MAG TPA: zf-HC2 domain-containing protein, partial [Candidatus Baltobacteraceae bacterium]